MVRNFPVATSKRFASNVRQKGKERRNKNPFKYVRWCVVKN